MGPLTQDLDENLVLQASETAEKAKRLASMPGGGKIAAIRDAERMKKEQFAYEAQKSTTRGLDSMEGVLNSADEEKAGNKMGLYPWFVLLFVVLVRVMVQSQRAIFSFAYGYTGIGAQAGDPAFELATAYPQLR